MNFIVVVDKKYGIGKSNGLLTHLTDDLKYFKRVTLNKVVVMGRKTLESLPKGKPFSNRINIVLTKDANYTSEGATIVHNLDELYQAISGYPTDDVFIIGGGQIYNLLYSHCRYGYITKIDEDFEADTFLDPIDSLPNWEMVWKSDWKENKGHKFVWTKYKNTEVII